MSRLLPVALVGVLFPALLALLPAAAQPPKKLPEMETGTHKTYTETVPDTKVSFEMIAIPGGTFLMGSPESEKGRADDEGPQHPVKVRPFWMGKMEVTWDEYDLYWRKNPNAKKAEPKTDQDKAADAVTRPTPPYDDETFGHGRKGNSTTDQTFEVRIMDNGQGAAADDDMVEFDLDNPPVDCSKDNSGKSFGMTLGRGNAKILE